MIDLANYIHAVPDFPKAGILFRDISPLLATKFPETITALGGLLDDATMKNVDAFAGIDARGFIFAAGLAAHYKKNLVMIRKHGKMPPPCISKEYKLEYGEAHIDVKEGSGKIVIVDDVIATGGTLMAAAEACDDAGYEILDILALIDLTFLNDFTWDGAPAKTLIQYAE